MSWDTSQTPPWLGEDCLELDSPCVASELAHGKTLAQSSMVVVLVILIFFAAWVGDRHEPKNVALFQGDMKV